MARKKQIEAEVLIEFMAPPNKGVGYINGIKAEIKNALPGQVILGRFKKKKNTYVGQRIQLIKPSEDEKAPECDSFNDCGGCTFQNIAYEKELDIKKTMVLNVLSGFEGIKDEIIPSPIIKGYRNKMEFSFGDAYKDGPLQIGMHKRNSYYEVAEASCCQIVDEDYRKIIKFAVDYFSNTNEKFYHKGTHEGSLRHLVIRKGINTGEILINLVTTSTADKNVIEGFSIGASTLLLRGCIAGILHTENDSVADVVQGEKVHILYGRDYFYEKLFHIDFKISPFSFFQTNSKGAEVLYSTVIEFAGTKKMNTIFDLYCGTGTITQLLSAAAHKVYGIEIVTEAISAAKENAAMNQVDNCIFIAGDVLKIVPELKDQPDLIVIDPPREGIHPKAILSIIGFNAPRIIYVSCKPTSLARDLTVFVEQGYKIVDFRMHDMFPRTFHVETVVLLESVGKE